MKGRPTMYNLLKAAHSKCKCNMLSLDLWKVFQSSITVFTENKECLFDSHSFDKFTSWDNDLTSFMAELVVYHAVKSKHLNRDYHFPCNRLPS